MRQLIVGTHPLAASLKAESERRGLPVTTIRPEAAAWKIVSSEDDLPARSTLLRQCQPNRAILALRPAEAVSEFSRDAVFGLIDQLADTNCTVVFFSRSNVFASGKKTYREDSPLSPTCPTGHAMAAIEQHLHNRLPAQHLIVRTGRLLGSSPRGWLKRTVAKLANGEVVKAASDVSFQPTSVEDAADVAMTLSMNGETGTVHAAGPDRHTEFTLARLVAHLHGFDSDLVESFRSEAGPTQHFLDRSRLIRLVGRNAFRSTADTIRAIRDHSLQPIETATRQVL